MKKRTVRKFIPPDVRAAMAWLQNRQPEKWKKAPSEFDDREIETDPEDLSLL